MTDFLTVEGVSTSEYEDRKSKFFGFVTRIQSEDEVRTFRHGIMEQIPDASHYVSAYRIQRTGVDHYSDAKEPHGTAGMPVLNVLIHKQLQDVVCVVARIFGGTLLGKGGLMRAYSQAAADAVEAATLMRCVECCTLAATVDYAHYDALVSYLSTMGLAPAHVEYTESVTLAVEVQAHEADALAEGIRDFCHGRAQVNCSAAHRGIVPL